MTYRSRSLIPLLVLLFCLLAAPAGAQVLTLQNDRVRVGVDLDRGGAITDLARPGQPTMVNNYDLGRQIQASYYSGPVPYGSPSDPQWNGIGWNPIQAGDVHGNRGVILATDQGNGTIYVKSRPMQWALNAVPCECTFEQWVSIDGQVVHVRHRMVNARADQTVFEERPQELPAVYTIGRLRHLWSFRTEAAFTGAPAEELPLGPVGRFSATEHWAAFVGDDGVGVGVVNPGVTWFMWGYGDWGQPVGSGGEADGQFGYISPTALDVIDHDAVYDYSYDLVVGTVADVRTHAQAIAHDPRPDYRFATDRQHTIYRNASDDGQPHGALNVDTSAVDPQIWGQEQWWDSATMPLVYVRAAFDPSSTGTAQLFWRTGNFWTAENGKEFPVTADGQMRTYAVRLDDVPTYRGFFTSLRFDPGNGGVPGSRARVEYVGFRDPTPPPPPPGGGPAPSPSPSAERVGLRVRVPRGQRVTARAGLRVALRCDVACRTRTRLRVRIDGHRILTVTARPRRLRAERWRVVRVHPRARAAARIRAILRAHPRRDLRVVVRASASGRADAVVRRRADVRRRRR